MDRSRTGGQVIHDIGHVGAASEYTLADMLTCHVCA